MLLLFFTAVLLIGSFSAVAFSLKDAKEGQARPFSLSGSVLPTADCLFISAFRRLTEDRPTRELLLPFLAQWPAIKLTLQNTYLIYLNAYLTEFLSILLFIIILSLWKNKKDGKKGRNNGFSHLFILYFKEDLS